MAWHTSDRKERLPENWQQLRRQTKARAKGKCQYNNHHPNCKGWGTDADHITPGDNHSLENLQWLSAPCHNRKTALETIARHKQRRQLRNRPTEPHPGQTNPPTQTK